MQVAAIVFDFDGVLADSEPLHLRVYQEILEPQGIHLDQATYEARYLGYDDVGVFQKFAEDYNLMLGDEEIELLIEAKSRRFQELVASGDVLYPGAAALVRRLGAAWPLGIASGAVRAETERDAARRRACSTPSAFIVSPGDTEQSKTGARTRTARRAAPQRATRGVRRDRRLALGLQSAWAAACERLR